ncbi:hypothetical protein [Paenibacillus sp. GCM10027626]|uniref:hypothetical protein n=1 Tax=Paenibacillus sp. GCM10027626 TaxID=3273411 RepID=UPI00363D2B0A
MYRKALDAAGYGHEPATEAAVRECFADYVAAGYWADVYIDELDEIQTIDMARALMR